MLTPLTDFNLGMGVVIKADNDYRVIGQPQVAMHSQLPRFLVDSAVVSVERHFRYTAARVLHRFHSVHRSSFLLHTRHSVKAQPHRLPPERFTT